MEWIILFIVVWASALTIFMYRHRDEVREYFEEFLDFWELKLIELEDRAIKTHMYMGSRIRLAWYRLFIREDEFHESLSMDIDACLTMNDEEKIAYQLDLMRRRDIAHRKDLEGKEGSAIRKELLNLLNKRSVIAAPATVDQYATEKGVTCTRVLVPKQDKQVLIVFIDNLALIFEYSGLFHKKWRNAW